MGSVADVYVKVRGDTTGLSNDVRSGGAAAGQKAGEGFTSSFVSMVRTAAAAAAGYLAGRGLIELGTMGIKAAADLQQAQVAFTTLIGNGQKAQAFLNNLKDFAAKTPFELPGLVDDARLLMGVGVSADQVIPKLEAWGNAAGALGISGDRFHSALLAVSQSLGAGKINAQDMNQIINAGIPIWKLMSEATGKTVPELRKLSEQGKLLSKDVLPAVERQMQKDYGGAMAAQSKTLTGVWSTLMDTIRIGMADSLNPVIPLLSSAIPRAAELLSGAMAKGSAAVADFIKLFGAGWSEGAGKGAGMIQQIGDAAHKAFEWLRDNGVPAVKSLASALKDLVVDVADVVRWFNKHRDTTAALAITIGVLVAITKLHAAVMAVEAAGGLLKYLASMNLVQGAIKVWTALQWLLNLAMDANPIGLIILAVGILIAVIAYLWTHSAGFRDFFIGVWNAIWGFLKAIGHWFAGPFADFFVGLWHKIVAICMAIHNDITSKFNAVVGFVSSVPGKIWGFFSSLPGKFIDLGKSIVDGIIHGIDQMIGGLVNKAKDMASKAWNAAAKAIGFGSPAKEFIKLGVSAGQGWVEGINQMTGAVEQAGRTLFKAPSLPGTSAVTGVTTADLLSALRDVRRAIERKPATPVTVQPSPGTSVKELVAAVTRELNWNTGV